MSVNKTKGVLDALLKHAPMDFSAYMDFALYDQEFGYYASDRHPFGPDGDFITAPNMCKYFSWAIAEWIYQNNFVNVIELGPGNGQMAIDIMLYLKDRYQYVVNYILIEKSGALIQHQRQHLQQFLPKGTYQWLKEIPKGYTGAVIANELLDALPCRRFCWDLDQGLREFYLVKHLERPELVLKPTNIKVEDMVPSKLLEQWPSPYVFEHCFAIKDIFQQLQSLSSGSVLFLDYGYEAYEYFHPDRQQGSLMAFSNHHSVKMNWENTGGVDMTVPVNWTHVMEVAKKAGFVVENFGPQADFLLTHDILSFVQEAASMQDYQQNLALKRLLCPTEMGQYVKVLSLVK